MKFSVITKKCDRFSDKIYHKIDFTASGLYRDHPPELE